MADGAIISEPLQPSRAHTEFTPAKKNVDGRFVSCSHFIVSWPNLSQTPRRKNYQRRVKRMSVTKRSSREISMQRGRENTAISTGRHTHRQAGTQVAPATGMTLHFHCPPANNVSYHITGRLRGYVSHVSHEHSLYLQAIRHLLLVLGHSPVVFGVAQLFVDRP